MDRQYVICTNPNCSFSTDGNTVMCGGCPYCGSDTIDSCPHCRQYIAFKGQVFCPHCRQPMKLEATEPHTSDNS